jgi:hypothetical protein
LGVLIFFDDLKTDFDCIFQKKNCRYRYRRFTLGDGLRIVVRTEADAYIDQVRAAVAGWQWRQSM